MMTEEKIQTYGVINKDMTVRVKYAGTWVTVLIPLKLFEDREWNVRPFGLNFVTQGHYG